jgi:hypothetical protein
MKGILSEENTVTRKTVGEKTGLNSAGGSLKGQKKGGENKSLHLPGWGDA